MYLGSQTRPGGYLHSTTCHGVVYFVHYILTITHLRLLQTASLMQPARSTQHTQHTCIDPTPQFDSIIPMPPLHMLRNARTKYALCIIRTSCRRSRSPVATSNLVLLQTTARPDPSWPLV